MKENSFLIAKGAEANLYVDKKKEKLIKERIQKNYRIKELDEKLRKSRTKHEVKILEKAKTVIPVPKILNVDFKNYKIEMEFIEGKILKDFFDFLIGDEKIKKISREIGSSISKLHSKNIIHNDLTTSNMLLQKKNGEKEEKVFFIDFGLGIHSTRIEDKAMDLVVLKKSLKATHPKKFNIIWKEILEGYRKNKGKFSKEIIKRIDVIEKRARYM